MDWPATSPHPTPMFTDVDPLNSLAKSVATFSIVLINPAGALLTLLSKVRLNVSPPDPVIMTAPGGAVAGGGGGGGGDSGGPPDLDLARLESPYGKMSVGCFRWLSTVPAP